MSWEEEKKLYLNKCSGQKLEWFYNKLKIKDILFTGSKLEIAKMFFVFMVGFRKIDNKLQGDEFD